MLAELLLVSPPDYETGEFRGAQPLGIAYLAAALRAVGIPARLLDANVHGAQPLGEVRAAVQDFVRGVRAVGGRPVVGFSTVSQVVYTVAELAAAVKAVDPEALVIAGGYHPTFEHEAMLADFPALDLCVRGEGEHTVVEIMQRWQAVAGQTLATVSWDGILGVTWRNGSKVRVNPSRPNNNDLDALPFPARDLLPPLSAYASYADTVSGKLRRKASMISSRGCPFHCNFCAIIAFYGDAGGKPWRGRSVENVVAEMEALAEQDGASHFEFQDDNFFVRPDRALAIVEQYAATGRDFSFAFLTRADQVVKGERYFAALRRAGLRYVSVGIESGSEASLERMVKQTGVEVNRRALQILHDHDVAAQVEFIMFEPGSTLPDLQDNLRFLEEQGLFGYFPPLIFSRLLLMPGTPIREQIEHSRGVRGDPHKSLPYDFEEATVGQVFRVMHDFQQRLGSRWYGLSFDLLDYIPQAEILAQQGGSRLDARALAELKLEFFALTRLPYAVLREALAAAAAGRVAAVAGPVLEKAERELGEVTSRVARIRGS